ncbi:ferredoxin [Spirillospora sp. NPDC048819]|uniref:ferredoxin n=1 Tax=Spirillospora sp. NPDC048819 TaxID=3155268 RepID=UPI00340F744F
MQIEVDRARCQGHALCSLVDEKLFPLDEEGYTALPDVQPVAPADAERARTGAGSCPERALRLTG